MDVDSLTIFDLSPPEKLQLVEDLWDNLANSPADIPIHEWQKIELAKRKSRLMSKKDAGVSWDEIKSRVREQHGR